MNEERKLEIFLSDSDEITGYKIRPLSAGSTAILMKTKSPFFQVGEKDEYQSYKALLDFIYVHCADLKEVIKTSKNKELFDEKVEEYAFGIDQTTLNKFNELT